MSAHNRLHNGEDKKRNSSVNTSIADTRSFTAFAFWKINNSLFAYCTECNHQKREILCGGAIMENPIVCQCKRPFNSVWNKVKLNWKTCTNCCILHWRVNLSKTLILWFHFIRRYAVHGIFTIVSCTLFTHWAANTFIGLRGTLNIFYRQKENCFAPGDEMCCVYLWQIPL